MPPGFAQENSVSLQQKPVLAAQQLHSLELLSAPVMELQSRIDAELKTNPLLELGPDPEIREEADPDEPSDPVESGVMDFPDDGAFSAPVRDEGDINEDRDGFMENLEKVMEEGGAMLGSPSGDEMTDSDAIREASAQRDRMFDSVAAQGPSLQELLMEQLRFTDCSDDVRRAAREIIGSIDDNGYLRTADGDIAQSASCTLETAERARELVQTFDPPGIAARSVQESLLLQLKRKGMDSGLEAQLVRDHLDDLARNRLPQIARALNVDMETLNGVIARIRRLNAYPASGFAPAGFSSVPYVEPECFVVPKNGDFEVIPNRESVPRFHISSRYLSLLDDPSSSAETKNFIREKLASAKNLLKDLDRRESTIMRIAGLIVSGQHDFFEKGRSALHPMTQSGIADKLNLHETTVSRAVAGKYMSTPQGLIAFRDFFSGGYTGGDGSDVSAGAIRDIIRNAIAEEDPAKPLSDSAVEKILQDRGLKVARRTIAKYREELGIPSSQLRRKYV